MRSTRSMVLLVLPVFAATLMVGCTPPPPPPVAAPAAPEPATPAQTADVQAAIMKQIPNAVIGHVSGVSAGMAAVFLGSPAPVLKRGESIQFTDGSGAGVANGLVYSVDTTTPEFPLVIVTYEPTATGRAPIKGDLAVYVPNKP